MLWGGAENVDRKTLLMMLPDDIILSDVTVRFLSLNFQEHLQQKREKAGITHRIGHNKYEPMDMEVKLSSELVGDLRSLVPEGNLLEDRYDNLKRRNLVAPGVRQKKGQRKFKLKKQEKRAWRGVTLDDVDVPIASV